MQKITPFLWFNDNAEEAMNFYISIFKDSKIGTITRYSDDVAKVAGRPAGSVMTATFELFGQNFVVLNGGPHYKFTEAISFVINCKDQDEIDYYWEKLSEGADPKSQQCGWLKDKFGLSWQVVPSNIGELLQKNKNAGRALMKMKKLDIATLESAE